MDFVDAADSSEIIDLEKEAKKFQMIISNDPEEIKELLTQKNNCLSVCGKSVNNNQLCFSCFTCSSDPSHLICAQCFDVNKHKDHKFLLKDNSGCCDCGDFSIIPQIICDNHQGYEKINQKENLEKISQNVKDNIQNYILDCNQKLNEIHAQLRPYCKFQHPGLVEIYFLIKQLKLQNLLEMFSQNESYYEKIQVGVILHNEFIKFIKWLINQNNNFIFLITKIVQLQNTNSNQTIFEDMIERQVVFECLGRVKGEGLTDICYLFHADKQFKQFMHQTYFKKLSSLFIFQKQNRQFQDQLKKMVSILWQQQLQKNQSKIYENSEELKQILEKVFKVNEVQDCYLICTSQFRSQHTQYCVVELMDVFFSKLHHYAVQTFMEFEEIQYSNINVNYSFEIISILSFRYDCPWFKDVLHNHLQLSLKEIEHQFNNSLLSQNEMKCVLNSNYFLIKFIDALGAVNPMISLFQEENLKVTSTDIINIGNLLIHQNSLLNIITKSISNLRGKLQNNYAKRNLTRILLTQCFKIVELKIQQNQSEKNQIDRFKEQFIKETDSEEQLIEKFKKLYLFILKRPIICEQLIVELLYLEYFDGAYKNPIDFLINLKQLFKIDDLKIVNQVLDHILSICLQNIVSNKFYMDLRILQVYQSSISNRPCLESVDLAFIRIYTYLYGNEGKQKFIQEIKRKQIPIKKTEQEIQDYVTLTLMSSSLELWNLFQYLEPNFEVYPAEVKESLSEAIINIFTLGSNLGFKDIEQNLKMVGIQTNFHCDIQIKRVCQLEQQTKKFLLKNQDCQFFDPFLFRRSQVAQGKIYERLIDQRKEESFILFGNYATYFLKKKYQEIIQKYNPIFTDFVIHYIDKNQIKASLNQLQLGEDLSLISYQLYHNQIVIGLKLYQNELNYFDIKSMLIERAKQNQRERKLCEQLIQNLNSLYEDISQQKIDFQNKSKNQKSFVKKKFMEKQQQLMKNIQIEEVEVEKQDDQNFCHSCRLPLNSIDTVTPVLISAVPRQELYEIIPNEIQCFVKNENINLIQWKLGTCQHYFHFNCLQNNFKQLVNNKYPAWLGQSCPACKQSGNIILPLNSSNNQQNYFFENLVQLLYELNADQNIQGDIKTIEDIVVITMFSLLFRLIVDQLSDKDEFVRNGKQEILKHFIEIMRQYCLNQQMEKEFLFFPNDTHFILDFMMALQAYIYQKINKDEYLQNMKNLLNQISTQQNIDTIKLFFSSFDLPHNEIQIQNNPKIDRIFVQFQRLEENIAKNIQYFLGDNYETFRFRYLHQRCTQCGFYNQKEQKGKNIALCLLCLKLYCLKQCTKTKFGNLNAHSEENHQGTSLFIDLDSTVVYLVTFPIIIIYENSIYFDDLGQSAQKDKHESWSDFKLENGKIQKIAKVLLNNQFQPIIMNQVTQGGVPINVQGTI